VHVNDELVFKAKAEVAVVIQENLEVAKTALNVYDTYAFLLTEHDKVEEFLKKEPYDRDEFQAEINKYEKTIEKIRKEMPHEIRMNMFLIECS